MPVVRLQITTQTTLPPPTLPFPLPKRREKRFPFRDRAALAAVGVEFGPGNVVVLCHEKIGRSLLFYPDGCSKTIFYCDTLQWGVGHPRRTHDVFPKYFFTPDTARRSFRKKTGLRSRNRSQIRRTKSAGLENRATFPGCSIQQGQAGESRGLVFECGRLHWPRTLLKNGLKLRFSEYGGDQMHGAVSELRGNCALLALDHLEFSRSHRRVKKRRNFEDGHWLRAIRTVSFGPL